MNEVAKIVPPSKTRLARLASYSAALAFVVTGAALVAARPSGADAWIVPALALGTGTLAGVFHARRLNGLLGGAVGGLVLGLASSLDLILYDVVGRFQAVAATLAVSLVLGLLLGGFIEFVLFVHHATHPVRKQRGGPEA